MFYTDDHHQIMDTVRRFCDEEINPHVQQWETDGRFPAHNLFSTMGKLGLLGITKPRRHGGMELDYTYQLAFCEALGTSRLAAISLAVGVQTDMATPALARHGNPDLCDEFLTKSVSGEYVACLGVSEIGAGSDMAAITTKARKDGADYIIDGGKMWTTNGTQADWICLLAVTGDGPAQLNKSLICVPLDLPGITVSLPLDKLGMYASDTAEIQFEGVRVPQAFRIGSEGRGILYQMQAFIEERIWAAASGLMTMERLIDETARYAANRQVYGRPLIENQSIQFKLAELQTEIELLRSLVYRTVSLYVSGEDVNIYASMVKLTAGRLQRKLTDSCLQYWGGMGFMNETDISRYYRDLRLTSIGGGADEVMLSMISRILGYSAKI